MAKTTILIVEDEAIVAADLASKLRQLGYEPVGTAANGEEAVSLASRLCPQLVLMDIWLQGPMDGITVAETIGRVQDTPVVYLTAHSDPATLARAKLTGPFGYILKPFDERELATQIELALYKHQTERQLRQQREWLQVTLASIGDAVIATNACGEIVFVNRVAESITGWRANEAVGKPVQRVLQVIHEDTGTPLESRVTHVLRKDRAVPAPGPVTLQTRDGRRVPIEDNAAPIRDASDQLIGAVLVFRDVTERLRAEQALRRAKDDWEETFNTVPDCVAILDQQHRIVRANKAMAIRLGVTPEQCVGRKCCELVHGTSERPAACPHARTCRDGTEYTIELDEPRLGGSFLVTTSPRFDASSHVVGTVHVARDITHLKRTERSLHLLNADLERRVTEQTAEIRKSYDLVRAQERSLLEAQRIAHLGNWEWDVVTDRVVWSDEVYRIFGLTAQESAGTHAAFLKTVHVADRARVQQATMAALAQPQVSFSVEHRIVRPNGDERVVHQRGEVTCDAAGNPQWMFGTVHDITDRRRAEEETSRMRDELAHVERAARMGELAASLAHEINQPLAAILSNAQAARRQIASAAPDIKCVRDILDDIIRDDKRAASVVHGLRVMLQKGQPKREVFDVNDVVREVVQILHSEISGRRASLALDLTDALPTVNGGRVEIQQVLVNLVVNALDAVRNQSPHRREVVIRTHADDLGVAVAVCDRGCGIPSANISSIFQPFFTTKSTGLGMGLAICRRIIESYGGQIRAINNQEGGATVSFSLPTVCNRGESPHD